MVRLGGCEESTRAHHEGYLKHLHWSPADAQERGRVYGAAMSAVTIVVVAIVVLVTSFLSGIFGMAGGLILLGVLLIILDVASAMILFGTTQLGANGWRAFLWRG